MSYQTENEKVEVNCNIIRDLIPSYLDGICSEDSKGLVEKHIAECNNCRESVYHLKKTELISEKSDAMEIDYLKKIRKYYVKKNQLVLGLLILLLGVGYFMAKHFYDVIPELAYAFVLPVLIISTYFSLFEGESTKKAGKKEYFLVGVGILLLGYAVILSGMCTRWVGNAVYPFGMQPYQIGSFVSVQLKAISILELAVYFTGAFFPKKKNMESCVLMVVSLTSAAITLGMLSLLQNLSTPDELLYDITKLLSILLLEGIILGIGLLIRQKNDKIRKL